MPACLNSRPSSTAAIARNEAPHSTAAFAHSTIP